MQTSNLRERLGIHLQNLGKLSVSILEYYVEQLTGENAIKILSEPYEREKRLLLLMDALSQTENEIQKKSLLPSKFLDIQFRNPMDFIEAMDSFEKDISTDRLIEKLEDEFRLTYPNDVNESLHRSAVIYASTLQKNIIATGNDSVTSRITATTLLDIRQILRDYAQHIGASVEQADSLRKLTELLQQLLDQSANVSQTQSKRSRAINRKLPSKETGKQSSVARPVFVSYAHEDQEKVRELVARLEQDEIDVWVDFKKLLAGNDWELEISKVIQSAKAVLICLSSRSIQKEGYVQKEIRRALDQSQEKPEGHVYIIPVRLDDCSVPDSLQRWQYVDLFENDGYAKLVEVLSSKTKEYSQQVIKPSHQLGDTKIEDVQRMVSACATIYEHLGDLYKDSGFRGYKPNAEIETNLNNLVVHYINHSGTMIDFLEKMRMYEGAKNGSSYSDQYWGLLKTWLYYPKTKAEQSEYIAWLKNLRSSLSKNQRGRLDDLL